MNEFDEFSFAYVDPLQKDEENKLEAEDEFSFAYGEPVTQTDQEVKEPEDEFAFAYGEQSEEQKNYPTKVKSYQAFVESPQIREQAVRFARDRLGYDDISPEDAVEEVIEHFRSFKVNEFTAGMDYNYTSAAAADSTKDKKAKQRFEDYRNLYTAFEALPGAFDEGGAPNAFTDYLEGIATAPSTYVSILPGIFTAGVGTAAVKAGAGATAQVAKEGVKRLIMESFKQPLKTIAANPIKTTIATEATMGALQNIAEQKTEQEIDVREDFSMGELTATAAISGLAPAALAVGLPKKAFSELVSRKSKTLLSDAEKAVAKRNEEATEAAREVLSKNQKVAKAVKEARKPLDREAVAAGEEELLKATQESNLADHLVAKLDPSRMERLDALAVELLVETGTKRQPKERTSDFVSRIVSEALEKEDDTTKNLLRGLYDKYNLNSDDILRMVVNDMYVAESSAMGKGLGQRGQTEKLIRQLTDVSAADVFGFSEEAVKTLTKAGEKIKRGDMRSAVAKLEETKNGTALRRLDDLRRALMTSQPATTFRNTVSGYTRVGFDTITRAFDQSIATSLSALTFGKAAKGKVGLFTSTPNADVFATLYGTINPVESRAIAKLFEQQFPSMAQKVFKKITDISDASGEVTGAATDKMVKFMQNINALNTASDNYFKNVALVGGMKRKLNEAAARARQLDPSIDMDQFNLEKLIRDGKFNDLFGKELKVGNTLIFDGKQALEDVAKEAMYFTFQRDPTSGVGKAFVNLMHSAPFLTTSLVPFPRFVANAMRFTYEYSPLYLVNKRVLKTIAGGSENYDDIAKGLVGSAALFGAMAFRQSEYAGDNWWEGKTVGGKTFDMRPFFPAAPYLFFADWITRLQKGEKTTDDRSFVTEAFQALSGTQFRAGFGVYALDKAYKDIAEADSYEAGGRILTQAASNIISTYSIPLTVGQDLYNTFLAPDDARLVKDTRTTDLLGLLVNKSLARVPGNYAIEDALSKAWGFDKAQVYESGTREEPLRRIAPITRQTYGVLLNERKNFFEKEIARLKISKRVIESRTNVPEADLMLNAMYGEFITNFVVPMMKTEKYKNLSDVEKSIAIRDIISNYKDDIKDAVRTNAKLSAPERFGYNPMERERFMKARPDERELALTIYHNTYGEPEEGRKGYDYEVLLQIIDGIKTKRKQGKYTGDLFSLTD
jgi:hypothetical protein